MFSLFFNANINIPWGNALFCDEQPPLHYNAFYSNHLCYAAILNAYVLFVI